MKKKSYKHFLKIFRLALLACLLIGYLIWGGSQLVTPNLPQSGERAIFYANQCDDDLRRMLQRALKSATNDIFLEIYTLSEPQLVQTLVQKSDEGVPLHLVLDKSSPVKLKKSKHIKQEIKDLNGLMHRKVLVVDNECVFIGSGNFTAESLDCDDNLFVGFSSKEFASQICKMREGHFDVSGQKIDFYPLPEAKGEALKHLMRLLDSASRTIHVAMFTLTHPLLIEKLIQKHRAGVDVFVVCDRKSASGASQKGVAKLLSGGVKVKTNLGSHTLHHKLCLVDGKKIAFGSANWTSAAFSHNEECLLVMENLSEEQIAKIRRLWHAIECTSE